MERGAVQGRSRLRKASAFAVGVGVHAVLLMAFAWQPPPVAPGMNGEDDARGIAVSLVRLPSIDRQAGAAPSEAEHLEKWRLQLVTDAPAASPSPTPDRSADVRALLDSLDRPAGTPSAGARRPAVEDPFAQASMAGRDNASPVAAIWPQVARCWRPRGSVPAVSVSVRLDDKGALAEAPHIVRPAGQAANPARREAEAEAVRAVIACAPFALRANSAGAFELDFPVRRIGMG